MTTTRLIAKNSIYNLIGQTVQISTALVIIPLIITHLGIKRYGVWAILSALSNYQGLLDMGSTCVKYIAEYKAKKDWEGLRSIISTGFYMSLFIVLAVYLLGYIFRNDMLSIFIKDAGMISEVEPVYVIMLVLFCIGYLGQFFQSILDGYQRMELKNLNISIQRLLNFILIVIILNHDGGLYAIFLAGIISWLVVVIINIYQVRKLFKQFSLSAFHFSNESLKLLFSFSWRMQITTFASWMYNNIDKLFLGHFTDLAMVSIYDIASKIKNMTRMPVTAYAGSIIPAASEVAVTSYHANIKDFYYRHSKYLLLIVFPINFFILANGNSLIYLWVGQGFEKAVLILQILIVGNTLNLLTGIGTAIARGINRPGIEARYTVFVTALTLFLGYFLTKYYGILGLSIASSIAIGLPSLWFTIVINRHLKINNTRYFYEIIYIPLLFIAGISLIDCISCNLIIFNLLRKDLLLLLLAVKFFLYVTVYFLILKITKYIKQKS